MWFPLRYSVDPERFQDLRLQLHARTGIRAADAGYARASSRYGWVTLRWKYDRCSEVLELECLEVPHLVSWPLARTTISRAVNAPLIR